MGLDMYLDRKVYIGNKWKDKKDQVKVIAPEGTILDIQQEKISEITEEVMYWRKANAIHRFFTLDQDDDTSADVSREQLIELLDICKKIIDVAILEDEEGEDGVKVIKNAEEVGKLLETEAGFFFGSTEYDEYYIQNIKETIEFLEKELPREHNWYKYSASY